MYSVSDEFLACLRGPHRLVSTVEVASNARGPWSRLSYGAVECSIRISRTSDTRREMSLTLADWLIDGVNAFETIDPYSTLLRLRRGIAIPGGTAELVPLGVFRVYSTDGNYNSMQVQGYSQEIDLIERRHPATYFLKSKKAHVIIASVIQDAIPGATVYIDPTLPNPVVKKYLADRDRMEPLLEVVNAIGGELSCDGNGRFVVERPADPSSTPVWEVDAGPDGVLVEYSKKRTRKGVYNGVVATGEDPSSGRPPVSYLAVDNDPTSPTYWYGAYGMVPRFYFSKFIYTVDQAQNVAESFLAKLRGMEAEVNLTSVPNPALEINDVITVRYPDNTTENHVIDELELGLDVTSGMTIGTRGYQDEEEA